MSVAWPQQRCQQPAAAIVPPRARCGTAAAAKQYRPHRHSLFGAGEKLPSPGTNSSCFVSNDAEPSPTQYATTPMRFYCLRVSNPLKSIVIVGSAATQTRVGGGEIVQLPCTGHPTHSTPADYGTGTDACSLILSRIDYCNAALHGAPSYSIKKLQRVQNNAARIVLEAPRRSHASPLLRTLH